MKLVISLVLCSVVLVAVAAVPTDYSKCTSMYLRQLIIDSCSRSPRTRRQSMGSETNAENAKVSGHRFKVLKFEDLYPEVSIPEDVVVRRVVRRRVARSTDKHIADVYFNLCCKNEEICRKMKCALDKKYADE